MADLKVCLVYYSTFGHVKTLADEIKRGAEEGGAKVDIFQVPETLPEEALAAMGNPPKAADPVMDREAMKKLPTYDAFIFGFPTRFGVMCAQMKQFMDGTGGLWSKGELVGKPVSVFVHTATQGGGHETTALTALPFFVHHGMPFVPLGYTTPLLNTVNEIRGGSAWGASALAAGDGSRQASDIEKQIARHQGQHAAKCFKKFVLPASVVSAVKPKIAIIYYSMMGHIKKLADAVKVGAEESGAEVTMFQLPETMDPHGRDRIKAMFSKMKGGGTASGDKVMDKDMIAKLADFDGFIFGTPTRFGMMCSQMKTFFDLTGSQWQSGSLVGKPGSFFVSTTAPNGGTETTALTGITQLTHHGMPFVPIGYSDPTLFDMSEVHGGSPYGASTFAGTDGSREPTETELNIAKHQGSVVASACKKFAAKAE